MTTTDERSDIERLREWLKQASASNVKFFSTTISQHGVGMTRGVSLTQARELAKRVEGELDALRMVIGEVVGKDHSELSVKLSTAEAERDAAWEETEKLYEQNLNLDSWRKRWQGENTTLRARVEELENRRKGGCRSNFVLPGNRSIVCGNRVFCGQECFDRMKAFRAPPADTGEEGKG